MLKRILCLAAVLLMMLTGAALADEKPTVVTTIYPQYDFVRAIAGDRVELTMLLKPGAEVHAYEPTPRDIMAIAGCDLFVYGGGESDEWVEGLLESTGCAGRVLAMMDEVPLLEEEEDDEHGHEDREDAEYDEHVWTSPKNVMLIVEALRDALCEIDPNGRETYEANAAAYLDELSALDEAFKQAAASGQRDKIVFGDRFPLLYFVREYGLDYIAAFPGCSSETEPSAAKMAEMIRSAEEIGAPVILYLELSNGSIAEAVAEQTNAETAVFYACHNVTQDDFEAGKTYLDYMWENVETLKTALGAAE